MIYFQKYTGNKNRVLSILKKRIGNIERLVSGHVLEGCFETPYSNLTGLDIIEVFPPKVIPNIFGLKDWITALIFERQFYKALGLNECRKKRCFLSKEKTWVIGFIFIAWLVNGFALCRECHSEMEVKYVKLVNKGGIRCQN